MGDRTRALLAALGMKSYATAKNYHSLETLWGSILENDPEHPHWNALVGISEEYRKQAYAAKMQGNQAEADALNEKVKAW